MPKQYRQSLFVTIAGVVSLMVFMGAGCSKSTTQSASTQNNDSTVNTQNKGENGDSPNDVYNRAVDVDVTDTTNKAAAGEMKNIISSVFGPVKTSGFVTNILDNGALSIEFTTSRVSASDDVKKLSDAFKAKGYHIDQTTVYTGTASLIASNKSNQITATFDIGDQSIILLYGPKDQNNSASEQ